MFGMVSIINGVRTRDMDNSGKYPTVLTRRSVLGLTAAQIVL